MLFPYHSLPSLCNKSCSCFVVQVTCLTESKNGMKIRLRQAFHVRGCYTTWVCVCLPGIGRKTELCVESVRSLQWNWIVSHALVPPSKVSGPVSSGMTDYWKPLCDVWKKGWECVTTVIFFLLETLPERRFSVPCNIASSMLY